VWPQYWDLYEPRGPAKGPNGAQVPPHQIKNKKKEKTQIKMKFKDAGISSLYIYSCLYVCIYCHNFWGCVTIDRVSDWMIWFIATLHTPLGSTGNYSAITNLYILKFTMVLSPPSPLAVFWQRNHNSLTVTSNHTYNFLCTAKFLSCHYSANLTTPKTRLNSNSSCVRFSLYSIGADPQKTSLPLLLRVDSLLQKCVYCTVA
jgi:hypothetical protein